METSTMMLILFAFILFGSIFGTQSINLINLGYIGYGAYVLHGQGKLGKKNSKKLSKKDRVKGGSIFE